MNSLPALVKRTTLIVRDAERSLGFYRDVLGLSVWYDDQIELSGVGLAAGKQGDLTRLVIMQSRDPVVGMIGLLQFVAPELPLPTPRTRLGIGDIVFVLQGDDVAGVHRKAIDFGVRIHAAPHEFSVRGAAGQSIRMTSLSLWDPDDYFIEYNQRHG